MPATVAEGQIRVTPFLDKNGHRWYLVEIGRARQVKRFNLSPTEIYELRDQFNALLLEASGAGLRPTRPPQHQQQPPPPQSATATEPAPAPATAAHDPVST